MFPCSFFARPKNEPKKGGLKSFLGVPFCRLSTQYNSPAKAGSNSIAYYCPSLHSLQNVSLFPKKIWWHSHRIKILLLIIIGCCVGNPKMARTAACLVAPTRHCVAGAQTCSGCHFRRPFLWFVSFGQAKEMNKQLRGAKEMNIKSLDKQ
jgi:hypothetical protein